MSEQAEIARCGWCGEVVGRRAPGEWPSVARIAHMRDRHPIQHLVAHELAPLLGGDMLYFPIEWGPEDRPPEETGS